jgi:hypothetical protein
MVHAGDNGLIFGNRRVRRRTTKRAGMARLQAGTFCFQAVDAVFQLAKVRISVSNWFFLYIARA